MVDTIIGKIPGDYSRFGNLDASDVRIAAGGSVTYNMVATVSADALQPSYARQLRYGSAYAFCQAKWHELCVIESKLKQVGKVDKAIEAAEKSIQQGNKMIDVLLEQRVWREGSSMALGEKRRQQPLRDVAHIEPGYAFKSKDAMSVGTKWLKIANVGLGEVTWDEKSFLPENFLELHSQFSLKKGEIVMAMTRPILSEKLKLAVVTECDVPSLLNQRVCRIRAKGNSYANEQLSILLRSKHVVRNISVCILGTDPPNISGREIENIKVPVIGDKERDDVFNDIESLSKSISILKDKVAALVKIRKSIINSMVM